MTAALPLPWHGRGTQSDTCMQYAEPRDLRSITFMIRRNPTSAAKSHRCGTNCSTGDCRSDIKRMICRASRCPHPSFDRDSLMLDRNSSSRWRLYCAGIVLVSILASACSATSLNQASSVPSSTTAAMAQGNRPLSSVQVSAAHGATVQTGDGATLSIGAHVLRQNGTASISSADGKVYDFHISVPWSGHVAVTLPVGSIPSGAEVFLAHGISANTWLAEDAVVRSGRITAEVSHLSPFKVVVCLLKNVRDCLAKAVVVYVAEKLVKDSEKKLIDDVTNQCGNIYDGTPACKLDDGSLPPALSPHGANPTITASGPVQGSSVPIQGGSVPSRAAVSQSRAALQSKAAIPASRRHRRPRQITTVGLQLRSTRTQRQACLATKDPVTNTRRDPRILRAPRSTSTATSMASRSRIPTTMTRLRYGTCQTTATGTPTHGYSPTATDPSFPHAARSALRSTRTQRQASRATKDPVTNTRRDPRILRAPRSTSTATSMASRSRIPTTMTRLRYGTCQTTATGTPTHGYSPTATDPSFPHVDELLIGP